MLFSTAPSLPFSAMYTFLLAVPCYTRGVFCMFPSGQRNSFAILPSSPRPAVHLPLASTEIDCSCFARLASRLCLSKTPIGGRLGVAILDGAALGDVLGDCRPSFPPRHGLPRTVHGDRGHN